MLPEFEHIKSTAKVLKKGEVKTTPFSYGQDNSPVQIKASEGFSKTWLASDQQRLLEEEFEAQKQALQEFAEERQEEAQESAELIVEPEIPMLSVQEHNEILNEQIALAFEKGKKEGEKAAERSQSMALITTLQELVGRVNDNQDKQLEGFRAISEDTSKALTAVLEKLMPVIKQHGYSSHITEAINEIFSNASPDLTVTLVAHASDKPALVRAMEAINPEQKKRMVLSAGGMQKGKIEIRWPDSNVVFDWEQLQEQLVQKLQHSFNELTSEFGRPKTFVKQEDNLSKAS